MRSIQTILGKGAEILGCSLFSNIVEHTCFSYAISNLEHGKSHCANFLIGPRHFNLKKSYSSNLNDFDVLSSVSHLVKHQTLNLMSDSKSDVYEFDPHQGNYIQFCKVFMQFYWCFFQNQQNQKPCL